MLLLAATQVDVVEQEESGPAPQTVQLETHQTRHVVQYLPVYGPSSWPSLLGCLPNRHQLTCIQGPGIHYTVSVFVEIYSLWFLVNGFVCLAQTSFPSLERQRLGVITEYGEKQTPVFLVKCRRPVVKATKKEKKSLSWFLEDN